MSFIRILASICLIAWPAAAQPGQPNAEGIWEIVNDAGNPTGWFKIYLRNGVYEGQIVKIFFAPGEDAATLLCTACRGVQKDAPALGLTFMTGMKKDGLAYENGRILNPLNGQLYRARMDLSEDGSSLIVQVYLTAEKLGEPRIWSRVPENSETRQLMAMPVKRLIGRRAGASVRSVALALLPTGCASLPRAPLAPSHATVIPDIPNARLTPQESHRLFQRRASGRPLTILALSGGGADGTHGAGFLAGWNRASRRSSATVRHKLAPAKTLRHGSS